MEQQHISLAVHGARGVEPVHVEVLGGGHYRLLYSPGLVVGVAAGDEIELLDDGDHFKVHRRGGNIAVQIFSREPVQPFREEFAAEVRDRLSGTLDGGVACAWSLRSRYEPGLRPSMSSLTVSFHSHPPQRGVALR